MARRNEFAMPHLIRPRPLLVAALAAALCVLPLRAEIIEQVLLKVNGEIFTKSDLEQRQVQALRQQMGPGFDLKTASDTQIRKALDDVTPQVMVSVIEEILLVQRGHELGYKMTDEQFNNVVDQIKKDNKIENEADFTAALKQEGVTPVELRRNIERQMLASRVQQNEVLGRVGVAEEEARRYYDGHQAEFSRPPSVTLREILIAVPKTGDAINVGLDEEARAKAEAIRRRALAGESFDALASALSEAPSRSNAGLIGPFNLSEVSADIRKLIEPMKAGEVTAVLRAQTGYQLLKVESMTTGETTPFEQARSEIGNRVFTDKRKQEYERYLEKLRSQAIIEWKNEDVRKAYEVGLQRAKTAPPPA
jgi:parvulin-like peptidyl-prolyl isomerase